MNNIENLILEFIRYINPIIYLFIVPILLSFPSVVILIIITGRYKKLNKNEKKLGGCLLIFMSIAYITTAIVLLKIPLSIENRTIADLNNENNVVFQEKNNNIEVYYIPKENNSKIDENVLKKANLKITIQQTADEKYYIYFNDESEKNKEVKKEDLKDFINNIRKQENYKEIEKNKKLTLEDFK